MALSKRVYTGNKHHLLDLEMGFNAVRSRTAEIQTNRDGRELLFVAGWGDWEAAALYLLVGSNIKGAMLNEIVVQHKVNELMAGSRGEPPREEWIGEVIMSNAGSGVTLSPKELLDGDDTGSPSRPDGSPRAGDDELVPEGSGPPGAHESGGWDPALGLGSLGPGPHGGASEGHRRADDPVPPADLHGAIPAELPAEGAGSIGAKPGVKRISVRHYSERDSGESALLLSAHAAEITLRVEGGPWQLIRLLSVAWDVSPEEAMLKLIVERLEDYQGQSLQFFTGAIEN